MKNDKKEYQLLYLYKKNFDFIRSIGKLEYPSYHLIKLKTGNWVPIITHNGYDIITNEKYYRSSYISKESLLGIYSFTPYYINKYKKSRGKIENIISENNYEDYNKIFYDRLYDASLSEISEYLKIIQSVGKKEYIDSINEYRSILMKFIYNNKILLKRKQSI